MRILVIEDNSDIAANLGDYLEDRGHTVDFAADGVTGLHLAVVHEFDAIVLDLNLPGMDGIEVCRKLRNEARKQTPVLMLTARDSLDNKLAGFDSGADDYLIKPFALQEVEVRLNALALTSGFKFSELKPEFPGVAEPRTGKSMGDHCEDMAKEWNISRDSQDEWAVSSHKKLAAAYERGFFNDLIAPFRGVERDNILRPDTSLEKLATLKPAFDKVSGRGTLTAANSTPLTDGAAAVLLASEEWARAHGHEPQAYLRDAHVSAVDFVHGEGLLMAPTVAVPEMLKRNGLTLQDFDIYEIHEAFAAQVLCTLRAWESEDYCRNRLGLDAPMGRIDPDKINLLGSSLATGHPFAATGARVIATAAKQLAERGGGRALVSICTAGGMGVVAIVER